MKLTKKQWARVRQSLYVMGSGTLKYLGVAGIINDDKSQILVLLLSGLLDLAFVKVDVPKDEPVEDLGGEV